MFLGFAIKVPMFPFHTWLPDAHTEAPTVGSVLLAAILLKLGTYGFIRIALPMLPEAAQDWAPWIGCLAVIGIIYGALGCLAQKDMKRLIAFSSVAHMGFVMLAHLDAHDVRHQRRDLRDGRARSHHRHAVLHRRLGAAQLRHARDVAARRPAHVRRRRWVGSSASARWRASACPGLAGFWGEFPAILSAFNPARGLQQPLFRFYMVVAAIGTVLAAGYLLWMLQKVAFGVPKPEFADAHIHDVSTLRVDGVDPDPAADRRARRLPEHHLPRHRPRGDAHDERDRVRDQLTGDC